MNEPYVKITGVLPICLHIDKHTFTYLVNDAQVEMSLNNFVSTDPTWVGTAKNMEVISDEYSHFRFTKVTLCISHSKGVMDQGRILEEYRKTFFDSLNKLISCCRFVLNRHGIRNFYDYNQFVRPVVAAIIGPANPEQMHIVSIPLGDAEGLASYRPNHSIGQCQQIQENLDNGIPLCYCFLLDAKKFLYHHEPIQALVAAVNALEIKISEIIRLIAVQKSIGKDTINSFIHEAGLSNNIKVTLNLWLSDEVKPPKTSVIEKCVGAITIRNKIIHEGRRDLIVPETQEYIESIESLLEYWEQTEKTLTETSN